MNNNTTRSEYDKKLFKASVKSTLKDYQWDYFITLTFKYSKQSIDCNRISNRFLKHLNKITFGRHSNKSVRMILVIEPHMAYGYHVHALIQDPTSRINPQRQATFSLRDAVATAWDNASPATARPDRAHFAHGHWSAPPTDKWFQPVDDVDNLLDYLLKTIGHRDDVIQWELLSSDGRRINVI